MCQLTRSLLPVMTGHIKSLMEFFFPIAAIDPSLKEIDVMSQAELGRP